MIESDSVKQVYANLQDMYNTWSDLEDYPDPAKRAGILMGLGYAIVLVDMVLCGAKPIRIAEKHIHVMGQWDSILESQQNITKEG